MKFEFYSVPRIVVERGGVDRVGQWLSGSRCVLVAHNAPVLAERVAGILAAAGLNSVIFGQQGEPSVASVSACMQLARDAGCDAAIGIGGGSAIDCAKAVTAVLANGGEPLDYMEVVGRGRKITKPSLPWVAVPTTAGTGAEATRNAVVHSPEHNFKASIRSEMMLPKVALIDAELAVSVPREVTAASGCDALCQVIESYTSSGATPMSDGLAREGITRAARSLRQVFDHPEDLDAREDMGIVALLSGITLTNAGLGAVHGIAAPMGGRYPVPHGVVCAALLPHVIEANVRALRARGSGNLSLARYADIGRELTGRRDLADAAAIDAALVFITDLTRYMRIPRLRDYSFAKEGVAEMVSLSMKASSMRYNPIILTAEELAEILTKAI